MDSLVRNESAQIENPYLTSDDWGSEIFLPPLDGSQQFQFKTIYSPRIILSALERAKYILDITPGPNREIRQEQSRGWLGFWIDFMTQYLESDTGFDFCYSYNVADPGAIGYGQARLGRDGGKIPAAWFVAGLEGHEGHRFAMDQVLENPNIFPIILFEDEGFMRTKKRQKTYLPQPLIVSMWSYYISSKGNGAYLTYNPYSSVEAPEFPEIFEQATKETNILTTLINETDSPSTKMSKITRSQYTNLSDVIIFKNVLSTTDRVRV